MEWSGMEHNGMEWSGMEWNRESIPLFWVCYDGAEQISHSIVWKIDEIE